MRTLSLFGKELQLQSHFCSPTGGSECGLKKYNLYIEAGGVCPAKCNFCTGYRNQYHVDTDKLQYVIAQLSEKDLINRVSITGAEPFVYGDLDGILDLVHGYEVSINTSSFGLRRVASLKNRPIISDIHVSRHHYDDGVNRDIFGINVLSGKELIELDIPLSLSCNLMRGKIDSIEHIKKYLDFGISIGARFVGFVGLQNRTDKCKDLFLDYESLRFRVEDGFLFQNMQKNRDNCKCENYLYMNNVGEIDFYIRQVMGANPDINSFVFCNNKLTGGFGKGVIL